MVLVSYYVIVKLTIEFKLFSYTHNSHKYFYWISLYTFASVLSIVVYTNMRI